MSFPIFLLVLLSVILHAGWNFLGKSSNPSGAFFALASTGSAILWCWVLWAVPVDWSLLDWRFAAVVAGSVVAECIYMIDLAYAYRKIDISLGYPMVRALPVLLIAVWSLFFGGRNAPAGWGWIGLAAVAAGCLVIPLKTFRNFRLSIYWGPAFGFILLSALGTTGYTILDSSGVRMLSAASGVGQFGTGCLYLFLLESGISVGLWLYVAANRFERIEMRRMIARRALLPLLSGWASSTAYVMILIAMFHVTHLSYLQAFRQMSLPVGVFLGIHFLKEKATAPRWTGVALIVIGLAVIALQK